MRTAAWLAWSSFSLFEVLVALDLFLGSRTAPEWTQVWYRRQPASSKPRTQFRRVNGFREMEILRRALGRQTLEVHPLATSPNAAQDCPKYYGLYDILLGREAETLKLTLCIGRYLTA